MTQQDRPEFDRYAETYRDLHAESIRISGEAPDYFARYKVQEVARLSELVRLGSDGLKLLDYGCGIGSSIPFFAEQLPGAQIHGVDVSEESLALATEKNAGKACFTGFDGSRLPYPDSSFDVVFTSCVFHHIEPDRWLASMLEIKRILRRGGEFFLFEHNPWNPLTRKVVRECPFDEHAVLLSARKASALMRDAGFNNLRTRYTVFFPRPLSALRPMERFLSAVPAGAQYFIQARH